MRLRHAVVVVCVALAMVVSPTIVAQETPTPTENTTNESETAGMGTQLTAFLQSSSAAANDSVENGMWQARFDQANASVRAQLVTDRTGSLESRLDQLRAQNETLQTQYENGSLTQSAYVAQQSQLNARIDALRTAINDTDEAAQAAGVNDSRLGTLRGNANNLTGQQVAGVATGLGGGPPGTVSGQGSPNGTGPPDETGPPSNQTQGGPSNDTGTNTTDGSGSDDTDGTGGNSSTGGADGEEGAEPSDGGQGGNPGGN